MSKMLILIKNELKKLFARKAIWALFIIIPVLVLGNIGINSCGSTMISTVDPDLDLSWLESEAEWLEQEYGKKDATGEYIDKSEDAYRNRAIAKIYRYIMSKEIDYDDWRYDILMTDVYDLTARVDMGKATDAEIKQLAEMTDMCDRDDWRGYYTVMVNNIKAQSGSMSENMLDAMTFKYQYCLDNGQKPGESEWRDRLVKSVSVAKVNLVFYLDNNDTESESVEKLKNTIAVGLYRLENNIEYNAKDYISATNMGGSYDNFWKLFAASNSLISVVGIMLIVIAGKIVAEEYSGGTIKFLLITPATRSKILWAKFLTVISVGIGFLITLYLSSGIFALIFSGGRGIGAMVIEAEGGVVHATSPFIAMLGHYALQSVGIFVLATMAFAISSLLKSTAVSVGVGISAYAFGSLFSALLAAAEIDVGRYLIFSNTDLSAIINGNPTFPYQTLVGALIVIAVHLVVFLLTAHDAFVRRDI